MGRGERDTGAALYLQRRRFWYACHRVGRANADDHLFHAFDHTVFLVRGSAIGGFDGPLPTAAALLACMPADRKAGAREFCIVALSPFNTSGPVGWVKWGVDVSLTSGTVLLV